ncbi:MAG: hypothetical protein QOG45_1498 [Chloroflexota bacterium]|nr:hypothetical protein [Chloroflexota bacterium]
MHPGVRIEADAVVLERWRAEDATALLAAVSESPPALPLAIPGVSRVEIHCDAANHASAGVARRLGFRLDRVVDNAVRTPAETGRAMIWVLERGRPPAAG